MSIVAQFSSIIEAKKTKVKKSSLIQEWLGFPCSQSTSIRIGYYLETLFNQTAANSLLHLLDNGQVEHEGELHQVDHFLVAEDGDVYCLETKCNLDLDRGKKRDVLRREEQMHKGLTNQFPELHIHCRVFCPFIDQSKEVAGLGYVMGLDEFIAKFNPSFTAEEFKDLGKHKSVHLALTN